MNNQKLCRKSKQEATFRYGGYKNGSFTPSEYNGAHRHLRKIDSAAPHREHNDIRAS